MMRLLFSSVFICIIACGGEARGEEAKRDRRKKNASASSGANAFGHKVEHAFLSVGGHLQKFFTGRDTITR